ncbi:iron ABC transporter permease [Neiella marina]|uniref:Iron ABC transporter permease n=1 Tax=Neiella holothuriorum TaxID=2870530 RepID=A0ABS7EIK8_9GAMM|nr:iron ABC transporter permease [Neiella holothuriorum]MBW8191591.1 iron ABC transporter permease [Neiella holothuriorum]
MRWPANYLAGSLLIIIALGMMLSLISGAMALPAKDSLLALVDAIAGLETPLSRLASHEQVVVMELRLPRLLLALFVGFILAQCGAVMQGLFRNPLADPGIIGVSSGAAVGAIVAIVLFPLTWGAWTIPASAFVMGLLTTLMVYSLAQSKQGTSVLILLLAGVAIAAFAGASIGFLSYFADDQSLRQLTTWQMGSLAGANSANLWLAFATAVLLAFAFQSRAGALNALLLGEAEARHLGISVERLKLELIVLTAVGVGVTVASAGIIGFIGLVVPHLVRLTTGPNHRALLPLSGLLGAALLMIADLLARTVVQPAELPVGLLTALLGAPFFLVLLIKQRQQWS